jgi:hypothetical protein
MRRKGGGGSGRIVESDPYESNQQQQHHRGGGRNHGQQHFGQVDMAALQAQAMQAAMAAIMQGGMFVPQQGLVSRGRGGRSGQPRVVMNFPRDNDDSNEYSGEGRVDYDGRRGGSGRGSSHGRGGRGGRGRGGRGGRGGRNVSESSLDAQLDKYMKGDAAATTTTEGAEETVVTEKTEKKRRSARPPKADSATLDNELDSYFKGKGGE